MRGAGPSGIAPAAGMAVAPTGGDAERRAGVDQRRLERADERPQEQPPLVQAHDRIGDQLARPVVGDLAATLDALDLDAARASSLGRREDVRRVGVPPERQDGGMLEQQQLVADPTGRALVDEPLLEGLGVAVGDPPEPARLERRAPTGAVGEGSVRVASTDAR